MKPSAAKNEWSYFFQIVASILIGAVITYSAMYFNQKSEQGKERYGIANIIFVDVQNKLLSMLATLDKMPYENVISEGYHCLVKTHQDLTVCEAHLNKIVLFPSEEVRLFMTFYGSIKVLNNVLDILHNPYLQLTKDASNYWVTYYYNTLCSSIKNAKAILKVLGKQYQVQTFEAVQESLNEIEKNILSRNPGLKEKLSI